MVFDAQILLDEIGHHDAGGDTRHARRLGGRVALGNRIARVLNDRLVDETPIVKQGLLLHDLGQAIIEDTRPGANHRPSARGVGQPHPWRKVVVIARIGLEFVTQA